MEKIFREVCRVPCEDGLELDPASVRGEEIRGADEYDGVRVRLDSRLAGARARLQVDIGFGDARTKSPPREPENRHGPGAHVVESITEVDSSAQGDTNQ